MAMAFGIKWCKLINMWCSDIDDEEMLVMGCDGECGNCEDCELIGDGD